MLSLRYFLVLLPALTLGGCTSAPGALPPGVSSRGATTLSAARLGPVMWVRSDVRLPGDKPVPPISASLPCDDSGHTVLVHGTDTGGISPARACQLIEESVSLIQRQYRTRARVTVGLVPAGTSAALRRHAIGWRSAPVSLMVAAEESTAEQEATLVAIVAHESTHVLGYGDGDPRAHDEFRAHYMGYCAQLAIRGELLLASLSPGTVSTDSDTGYLSSTSGNDAAIRELLPLFRTAVLRADSSEGRTLQRRCEQLFPARR